MLRIKLGRPQWASAALDGAGVRKKKGRAVPRNEKEIADPAARAKSVGKTNPRIIKVTKKNILWVLRQARPKKKSRPSKPKDEKSAISFFLFGMPLRSRETAARAKQLLRPMSQKFDALMANPSKGCLGLAPCNVQELRTWKWWEELLGGSSHLVSG